MLAPRISAVGGRCGSGARSRAATPLVAVLICALLAASLLASSVSPALAQPSSPLSSSSSSLLASYVSFGRRALLQSNCLTCANLTGIPATSTNPSGSLLYNGTSGCMKVRCVSFDPSTNTRIFTIDLSACKSGSFSWACCRTTQCTLLDCGTGGTNATSFNCNGVTTETYAVPANLTVMPLQVGVSARLDTVKALGRVFIWGLMGTWGLWGCGCRRVGHSLTQGV
jgi:hypothetical protein